MTSSASSTASARWWQSSTSLYLLSFLLLGSWLFIVHTKFYVLRLPFDDAYMFYRYAIELRNGYGITWNPGGLPTYGVTSPLWLGVVWLGTFVSRSPLHIVTGSSVFAGVLAMAATSWAAAANARTQQFQRFAVTSACVLVCCVAMFSFTGSAANGMETSMSFAALALLLGVAERWRHGRCAWFWVPMAGMVAFLCRPESALATCLLIAIAWACIQKDRRWQAWAALGLFLGMVLAQLLLCTLYFHTPLPLSFYVKSQHSYVGYIGRWFPVTLCFDNLRSCRVPLLVIGLFATWRDRRLLLFCLLPAAACMLYLATTLQIMGFWSRYYVPYSPFVMVLALLLLDRRWQEGNLSIAFLRRSPLTRAASVVACLCLATGLLPRHLLGQLDRMSEGKLVAYAAPDVTIPASAPLPAIPPERLFSDVGDRLVLRLPQGSTMAASEVGLIAANAPGINIVDLVGLNDADIARHGFRMDALLSQQPDVIWFPHPDYTHQRGVMMSDPRLLRDYDFYPGAANFGLAVRKDGPQHTEVEEAIRQFWHETYPAQRMQDYAATAVTWSGDRKALGTP